MTQRSCTEELAALKGVSTEKMVELVIAETRHNYDAGKDVTSDWGMVLVEEIERLRQQAQPEARDPEAAWVVRAMLAGLLMQGELANPAVFDSPEKRVKAAVRGADLLLAALEQQEAHGS